MVFFFFLFCFVSFFFFFFFFNDTATTEIYTLSLHDALPILVGDAGRPRPDPPPDRKSDRVVPAARPGHLGVARRSAALRLLQGQHVGGGRPRRAVGARAGQPRAGGGVGRQGRRLQG